MRLFRRRGASPPSPTVRAGDVVRVTYETTGMPAGSEGVVLAKDTKGSNGILVSFWDGGPLTVPLDAVELVERKLRHSV
jgi:hypothetical protein